MQFNKNRIADKVIFWLLFALTVSAVLGLTGCRSDGLKVINRFASSGVSGSVSVTCRTERGKETEMKTPSGASRLIFSDAEDSDQVISPERSIRPDKENGYVVFKYLFTNTSDKPYEAELFYGTLNEKTVLTQSEDGLTWTDIKPGTKISVPAAGETTHYVRIDVAMPNAGQEDLESAFFWKLGETMEEKKEQEEVIENATPVTDRYGADAVCDYCEISADGTAVSSVNFGCTSFMDCRGAEKLTVTLPQTTAKNPSHGLAFYNAEKEMVKFIPSPSGAETAAVIRQIDVPGNAAYFKTTYFNYSERKSHNYGDFRCEVEYPEGFALPPKRNYQDGVIYFSQEINQSLDVSDTSDMKQTTAALMLPKTYTPDGTPTKMILYFHGYSHTIYYGHLGQTANFAKQKENFTERGYAVLCFNGARDNGKKGEFPGGGIPQFDRAAQQCIEYVLNHYNVDSGIYVVGGSAGGLGALTYVRNYGSVEQTKNRSFVKALMLLSGWTDIRANPWACGVRKYYAEYLGVSPDGEYPAELDAINPNAMTAEQLAGTNLGKIPTYAFMGAGEITETAHIWYALHDYMGKISTLPNYRGFRIFDEYEHSQIVSGGVPAVDNAVCDFFDDPSGSFLSNAVYY